VIELDAYLTWPVASIEKSTPESSGPGVPIIVKDQSALVGLYDTTKMPDSINSVAPVEVVTL
jgi:hypothetical protein